MPEREPQEKLTFIAPLSLWFSLLGLLLVVAGAVLAVNGWSKWHLPIWGMALMGGVPFALGLGILLQMPQDARVSCRTHADRLDITFPPPGLSAVSWLQVGLGALSMTLATLMIWAQALPPWVGLVVLVVVALPLTCLFFWLPSLRTATRRFAASVSADSLRVRERAFLRNRTVDFAADELAELALVQAAIFAQPLVENRLPGYAILARSASHSVTFGQGLSEEELRWAEAVIRKVLTSGMVEGGG